MVQADNAPGATRVYQRSFRVRVQVSADGHVRDSVYLNYYQQARRSRATGPSASCWADQMVGLKKIYDLRFFKDE